MSASRRDLSEITQRLADRQKRLEAIESERAVLKQEIQVLLQQLLGSGSPSAYPTNRSQVLALLHSNAGQAFAPADICRLLGKTHYDDLNAIRLVLGRLLREGKVKRISHGRYQVDD